MILRQSVPKIQPHMCISLNKANRIRLIVSSTDISEEAELRLTSMLNETIKNYWVALGQIISFLDFELILFFLIKLIIRIIEIIYFTISLTFGTGQTFEKQFLLTLI